MLKYSAATEVSQVAYHFLCSKTALVREAKNAKRTSNNTIKSSEKYTAKYTAKSTMGREKEKLN